MSSSLPRTLALALWVMLAWVTDVSAVDGPGTAPSFRRDVSGTGLQLPTRSSDASRGPAGKPSSLASSSSLWVMLGGVAILFGGLALGITWLKQHGPAGMRGLPAGAIELLGRKSIEPRMAIHLVRCGTRILVLGTGPDGVRTLAEITDPVEIDLVAGACRPASEGAGASAFSALFARSTAAAPHFSSSRVREAAGG